MLKQLKQMNRKQLLVWASALFLFLLCMILLLWISGGRKLSVVSAQTAIQMQAVVEKIEPDLGKSSLWGTGSDLKNLYDGKEKTVCGMEDEAVEVVIDLGVPRRLAGVRFLPDPSGGVRANRCLGTQFSVGNSKGVFYPVARIEAAGSGDLLSQWYEILFDSSGEFQYLRVEIPPGGYLGEVEWLEYSAWTYKPGEEWGKKNLCMDFYVHEVQKDTDTVVLTAVYDEGGVMTNLVKTEKSFNKEQNDILQIEIPDVSGKMYERVQVMVWEKNGTPAIPNPLQYRNNDCAPELTMSNMFSDDMLFQAEMPLTIWGKGPIGKTVTVTLEEEDGTVVSKETVIKNDFSWEVVLGSFPQGGTYRMTVDCGNIHKEFQNITFGDLWLCVGQSNMDYFMLGGDDTREYLESKEGRKEANNPNIRLLNLWNKGTGGSGDTMENLPLSEGEKAWQTMRVDVAHYCSAVGYFFAQDLEQTYHNPIGIISAAVGDTEINRWIPYGETYGSFTGTDGGLFHNRVEPFSKLKIRGILLYQGEADQYRTDLSTVEYRDAMVGLVNRYRGIWGADLPFYWAQLTRHKKDESAIREGQRLAYDRIQNKKNAGLISLIDLYGEYEIGLGNCREDIHPHQKKEVAERFLRYVKRDVYGEDIPVSGPVYRSVRTIGRKLEITFDTTGDLTVLPVEQYTDKQGRETIKKEKMDTDKPGCFEIAGKDGVYYPAKATIRENLVILESSKVRNPVSARYAWGAYPEMPNLTDETGLPALSFSTEIIP